MKLIFAFLMMMMMAGHLMAGETCVWQVYRDSFTQTQWDTVKDVAHAKVANMSQPIRKFLILKRPGGLVVQGDCAIRTLTKIQTAEAEGKIRYIGLKHYTRQGYTWTHPDRPILKQFFYNISKSTYTVETSTP